MLRSVVALVSLAALASPAMAQETIEIGDISIGEPLMEKADEYGEREFDRLVRMLERSLERELGDRLGESHLELNIQIVDAWPNRPTAQQLGRGLHMSSMSIGGASLEAQLVHERGMVVDTFEYTWRTHSIRDAVGHSTWTDTRRVFNRFADQIADSLDEGSDTGS